MRNFSKLLLLFLFTPLLYAFVAKSFLFLFSHFVELWSNWFLYGALLYVILYVALLWAKLGFLETFEHEMAHMVMGYLFFNNAKAFVASWRKEGFVQFSRIPNTLIILAPYFLPVFTLPFLFAKPFVTKAAHNFVNFFLGLTLAFHLISMLREFGPKQSDIFRVGLKSSLIIVFVFNCIFAVITLGFALDQYAHLGAYFKDAFVAAWQIYAWVFAKVFSSSA
ncbi:hypothetical protein HUU05_18510 [candidate division KSB1 bacterium]|nr:hypothetical protein [candidate division KSB1 bacterium]